MYRSIIKLWTKVCTDLNCTYECVWVTYQEGKRWLRSRCAMQNVGLTKNTLIKNTHALFFTSLKLEWVTLFCALISPLWFHNLIRQLELGQVLWVWYVVFGLSHHTTIIVFKYKCDLYHTLSRTCMH